MTYPPVLPDTRPYPAVPVKNHLLLNACQLAHNPSAASQKLASEQLQTEIRTMFAQNHYTHLSLALTMSPDPAVYRSLTDCVGAVLQAEKEDEVQWFALPVVIVAGCKHDAVLPLHLPTVPLSACLENYPRLRPFARDTRWLPHLVSSDELSSISPGDWWQAKQSNEEAEYLLQRFPAASLPLPEGQSVHTVYALGYGSRSIQPSLGLNLQQAGLPLMQVWQEAFAAPDITLFTNPLSPDTPLKALAGGSHTCQRMALDVFSTNAIRAIRLQSPRVGVVAAARAGGQILFGFNATDSAFEIVPQVFVWQLAPSDSIETIQQDFLELMVECRVEHIRFLHDALPENGSLPTYSQALKSDGHNPLLLPDQL